MLIVDPKNVHFEKMNFRNLNIDAKIFLDQNQAQNLDFLHFFTTVRQLIYTIPSDIQEKLIK